MDEEKNEIEEFDPVKECYEWVQCIVVALIACILLFSFFGRVIDVIGHSMENSFHDGDKVITTRLAGDYRQGDVVVLHKDGYGSEPLIKRVIAVGGQTVDIDFDAGIVYVDGEALDEPYTKELTYERENFSGPVYVPEGCIWVMGDNRNNSLDSRYFAIGCVDTRCVIGKVVLRIWPLSKIGAAFRTDAFREG